MTITTRRNLIGGAAAVLAAGSALPALAETSDNPMPPELRQALERDPDAPVLGNPRGRITLTEFFDYNCGFCRQNAPIMEKLILADPDLRVVFREWPVFGEGSLFAAQASLASLQQGKYWAFHRHLMAMRGRATEATVIRTAEETGLDIDRLRADMHAPLVQRHITRSLELAEHMGLLGTPTFIAGDEGRFGLQTQDQLASWIASLRAA